MNWGVVAAAVVLEELLLKRLRRPLLSHTYWDALDDPRRRPVAIAGAAVLVAHLPWRRPWPRSVQVGVAAIALDLTLQRIRRR